MRPSIGSTPLLPSPALRATGIPAAFLLLLLLLLPLSSLQAQPQSSVSGEREGMVGVHPSAAGPGYIPVLASPPATPFQARGGARSPRLVGAGMGFVVGAGATWGVLNQGGSTARCDRDQNQDAWSGQQCLGAYALGGLAGAGIGALIGGIFRSDALARPLDRVHLGWSPGERGGRVSLVWR